MLVPDDVVEPEGDVDVEDDAMDNVNEGLLLAEAEEIVLVMLS